MTDRAALRRRIDAEIAREPRFDRWTAPSNLDLAIESTLERIEEWDYKSDPHGWCHERTLLLALLDEVTT
jgi:hypothetical protein